MVSSPFSSTSEKTCSTGILLCAATSRIRCIATRGTFKSSVFERLVRLAGSGGFRDVLIWVLDSVVVVVEVGTES